MELSVPSEIRKGGSPADTRLDSNVKSSKDFSYFTLIVSGGLHELYTRVDRPILLNRKPMPRRSNPKREPTERSKEYRLRNSTRAFNLIRRLIYMNFGVGSKFLTLTFSDECDFDITNLSACNKRLAAFVKRLRKQFLTLKYLAKPEFQKRGAVHYHLVTDIGYIEKDALSDLWGHGFIDIRMAKTEKEIGPYLTKYLGKDFNDERFKGHKSYFYSNNLKKPRKFHFEKVDEFQKYLVDNNLKPDFESKYNNEYSGVTEHQEFHLPAPFDSYEQ